MKYRLYVQLEQIVELVVEASSDDEAFHRGLFLSQNLPYEWWQPRASSASVTLSGVEPCEEFDSDMDEFFDYDELINERYPLECLQHNKEYVERIKQALIAMAHAGLPRPSVGDHRKHESGFSYHELAQMLNALTGEEIDTTFSDDKGTT